MPLRSATLCSMNSSHQITQDLLAPDQPANSTAAPQSVAAPTPPVLPAPPRPTPLQTFTATLSDKQILNEKFQHLRFELKQPNRIQFQAGQYILLSVPTTPQRKSYSIVNAPSNDHAVELLVDITPMGPGSRFLMNLKPGEEASFMAPVGLFTIPGPETEIGAAEKSLVFIATASGIAPFKSMLEDLLVDKNEQRPIILYWGLRYSEDQFWFDEFLQLAQQHSNFTFHPTLSKAPDGWKLCRGRVTDCLTVHPLPVEQAGYYLCGNSGMINDVKQLLLDKGIAPQHIHHEKFY